MYLNHSAGQMASVDLSESLRGASDEVLELECQICQQKRKHTEAKHFCKNCDSYICDACKDTHGRIPDLLYHKICRVAVKKNDCGLCLNIEIKKEASHYCKMCGSYICSECVDAHRTFPTLKDHVLVLAKLGEPSVGDDMCAKFSHLRTRRSSMPNPTPRLSSKSNERKLISKSARMLPKQGDCVDGARPFSSGSYEKKTKSLTDMTVRSSYQVNVEMKNDRSEPWITGCCFMPRGDLVLCDSMNNKLKLLDRTLTLKSSVAVHDGPCDVADVDGRNVVVTRWDKRLQFIQVLPTIKSGQIIPVDVECYRITAADGLIYVSCQDGAGHSKINVYDVRGILKRSFNVDLAGSGMFREAWNIAVNPSGDKIFVSDCTTDKIYCLRRNGTVVWQFKDYKLRRPEGLHVDENDNIIVCNIGNQSVDIITSDGKQYVTRSRLSSGVGLRYPKCTTFRADDGTLVIGCSYTGVIHVYKFS